MTGKREQDERTGPTPVGPDDDHIGAVEGDRPTDRPNQGNPNAPGVNAEGLPDDPVATCEDAIGANIDRTEGG